MTTNSQRWFRILLIAGVILAANVLLNRLFFRLDFTGDNRYTLSNPTKDILKNLDDPVTVSAYFSEGLEPQIELVKSDFKDLLEEYSKRSGGNLVYEFINPSESAETEQEAQQAGIPPITIQVRERDEQKQKRVYLGAVVKQNNQKEVIPFMQPGAAMEYALSSSIKKISVVDKPKLGFIQGHGEPAPNELTQVNNALSVLFEMVPVTLDTLTPDNYKGLVLIAPTDSFVVAEFDFLDAFLNTGKGLFVAMNRVDADIQQSRGTTISTGLETWLTQKGVTVENNFITDANCGSVSVQRQTGFFSMNVPVQFPYLPIIQEFADHPITNGLEQVLLQFASSLSFPAKDGVNVTSLAFTSGKSGTVAAPTSFDINKQWEEVDFPLNKIPVAVALEGSLTDSNVASKMVVIADGDFATNGSGQEARQVDPNSVSFMVNAIEWLNDDTGLSELRTKEVTSRPIKKELDDTQKAMIKWGNFLMPMLLIGIYGIIRLQFRNRKKNKWRETRYV